jgi:DNA mismatch endonuclease (patch repair protein)
MPDNLTPTQRSRCMALVKSRDTSLERLVRSELHRRGFRFRKHVKTLPGSPDLVFPARRLAVFIDGDFWHGWRFPNWQKQLSPFWRDKIAKNRRRDFRNFRKLRARGWKVVRIWQHTIERDFESALDRIVRALQRDSAVTSART